MRNMKLTALCLSAAITLSTITAPVLASTDVNKANIQVKGNITVSLDKSKDFKLTPGKMKFMFSDSENYLESMAWAIKAIEKLGAKGILKGYPDKSFKPQGKVTNLEALSLILELTNKKYESKDKDNILSFLNEYQKQWNLKWGLESVIVAVKENILLEEEIKGFNPNQPVKRHELAKYLIRAIDKTKDAEKNMNSDLDFKDANAIPKASRGYVYMVNKLEIMTGVGNGQFKPNEPLTRAEIAVIIERAEYYLDDDNDDENAEGIVFVSYNNDNNRLYVRDNGTSTNYTTIEDVTVYKDNDPIDIEDLNQGDILELVFRNLNTNQVVFIEVVGHVEDEVDEDREEISFTNVSYSKLPASIQKDIDTLRVSKGYKAYKYDNEIYLVAFMGKKTTGGYKIEIQSIDSYELSNDKYVVEAVVKETKPKSSSFVTQQLTYEYTAVKFDSFDNLQRINFVDEDGDLLAQKPIVDLGEETTASGILTVIDEDYDFIEVLKDKVSKEYAIADDVKVYVNNKIEELEDLKVYMNVRLTLVDKEVTKIYATYQDKEVKGLIQSLSTIRNQIKVNSKTYTVEEDTEITLDDKDAELSELETGMEVNIVLFNDRITNIDAENFEESYEGRIRYIDENDDEVESITLLVNSTRKLFKIAENTEFIMLDDDAVPTDLDTNSEVEINLINGKVIEVIETK